MASFRIVIPARYASERLPAKALRDIAGKPLIQHVYERARASNASEVLIATDDERIRDTAESFGADVCMTSVSHQSGTDRIAEVVAQRRWDHNDIIVNLQGDEPLMPVELLEQVANDLAIHTEAAIATLGTPLTNESQLADPAIVKIVCDRDGYAMYFSRAPIPWHRNAFAGGITSLPDPSLYQRHLGVYAYRVDFLREYQEWAPCALEKTESLEQLRVLWFGKRIHVSSTTVDIPAGVDTEEDLKRVTRYFLQANQD